jgi:deazaflavin-dependent oxidoreductase (nitroreductase family)
MVARVSPFLRWAFRVPNVLYDHHLGWLLGRRLLRLTHVGRSSGREYHTVLEVVGADRQTGEVFVVAGFGPATDWYRNLRVHPAVRVETGRRSFRPVHRELGEDEAFAVIAAYERRNRAVRPLVRKGLSWLVGWRYDGSDQARRRLVGQLPVVAFRSVEADSLGG